MCFILKFTHALHDFGHRRLKQVAGDCFIPSRQQKQVTIEPITIGFVKFSKRRFFALPHSRGHSPEAIGIFSREMNDFVAYDQFRSQCTFSVLKTHSRHCSILHSWRKQPPVCKVANGLFCRFGLWGRVSRLAPPPAATALPPLPLPQAAPDTLARSRVECPDDI